MGIQTLPAFFADQLGGLPARLDAYVVDALIHDDQGEVDAGLETLQPSDLYHAKGKSLEDKRGFFLKLYAGKFASIDWEADLILPLARKLDDAAPTFASLILVYANEERRGMHEEFCGRIMHAMGKLQTEEDSLAAYFSHWRKVLQVARRHSAGMGQDCLAQIDTLMTAVWSEAEHNSTIVLKGAGPWSFALAPNLQALTLFDKWAAGMTAIKELANNYKRTLAHVLPPVPPGRTPKQLTGKPPPTLSPPGVIRTPTPIGACGCNGSRVTRVDAQGKLNVAGPWLGRGWNADRFHEANVTLLYDDAGMVSQCIAVVTAFHAASLQDAEQWCDLHHSTGAPEHAGFARRTEMYAKMHEDKHYTTIKSLSIINADDARTLNQARGRGRGATDGRGGPRGRGAPRGGGGRGPFRGRTARPKP